MKQVLFILLILLPFGAGAQGISKTTVDTTIIGTWKLKDPGDALMLRKGREVCLRETIVFGHRREFSVPKEYHQRQWEYNAKLQAIEIVDLDEMRSRKYMLESLTANELVFIWGDKGYKLIYLKEE